MWGAISVKKRAVRVSVFGWWIRCSLTRFPFALTAPFLAPASVASLTLAFPSPCLRFASDSRNSNTQVFRGIESKKLSMPIDGDP